MKKLSTLLSRRLALLHKARVANLAFAYATLQNFVTRIRRAQLSGRVILKPVAPQAERYLAALAAWDINQSVIEEHFSDEDIMELADVLAFVTGSDAHDLAFALEDVDELFLLPLRTALESEGIIIDRPSAPLEEPHRQG